MPMNPAASIYSRAARSAVAESLRQAGGPRADSLPAHSAHSVRTGQPAANRQAAGPVDRGAGRLDPAGAEAAAKASLRTRELGFRLGRLGFRYSSQDYSFGAPSDAHGDALSGARTRPGSGQGFASELEVAVLRRQMAAGRAFATQPPPHGDTPMARRRATGLYARNALYFDPLYSRRLIAVA